MSSNSPNVNYIENYIFEWVKSSDGHMTYWNINLTTKVNEKLEKKSSGGSRGGVRWGRGGLFLKQIVPRRAEKKIFLRPPPPPPPYLRVWMTGPPPLSEGLDRPLKRDNGELKRAWMSSIREVQNVLGQVIFKINEAKKKNEYSNSREEWGIEKSNLQFLAITLVCYAAVMWSTKKENYFCPLIRKIW